MPTSTFTPGPIGAQALAYASKGIRVFPLWHAQDGVCQCKDGRTCKDAGKHPRTRFGVKSASNRPTQIEAWWQAWPDANIGLPAADNGLAVIDVDPRHDGNESLDRLIRWCLDKYSIDLMATRVIRTGSGGLHLYYQQPHGGIKSGRRTFGADGIDTRGRGGYLVAPPSVHASGGRYEVISNLPLARWPMVLSKLMNPPSAARTVATQQNGTKGAATKWAFAALLAECAQLRDLPRSEGNGKNQALNTAAYKMGRRVGAGYIDGDAVEQALLEAARGWPGHGERELTATIRSGMQAGARNPHPGPTTRRGGEAR